MNVQKPIVSIETLKDEKYDYVEYSQRYVADCPCCSNRLGYAYVGDKQFRDTKNFCSDCGQEIDWSDFALETEKAGQLKTPWNNLEDDYGYDWV